MFNPYQRNKQTEVLNLFFPAPIEDMHLDLRSLQEMKPNMKLLYHRTAYLVVMANYVKNDFLQEAVDFHRLLISTFESKTITQFIPSISGNKWPQKLYIPTQLVRHHFHELI
jgi:hypothetical protein